MLPIGRVPATVAWHGEKAGNINPSLRNYRTVVIFIINHMDRTACFRNAGCANRFMDLTPIHPVTTKCRQQAWVYIDNPASIGGSERIRKAAHIPSQHHKIDIPLCDSPQQDFAIFIIRAVRSPNHHRLDTRERSGLQSGRTLE